MRGLPSARDAEIPLEILFELGEFIGFGVASGRFR